MLHWYSKVTIILRKRKNGKETIIVRRREYKINLSNKEQRVYFAISRESLKSFQKKKVRVSNSY
jgi:hypothetical protein